VGWMSCGEDTDSEGGGLPQGTCDYDEAEGLASSDCLDSVCYGDD
jgi:hypothetical protein